MSSSGSVAEAISPNWSGFQSNTTSSYQSASASWSTPVSSNNPGGNTYESSWIGIGSGDANNEALLQSGTETDVTPGGGTKLSAWWEFYPENNQQPISGVDLQAGANAAVTVAHTGYGLGGVSFCGVTKCVAFNVNWSSTYTLQTSQYECIAERTEVNKVYPYLTYENGLSFGSCQAQTTSGSNQVMGNNNRFFLYMSQNKSDATCGVSPFSMETGDINGGYFPLAWESYGYNIAANGCY